jgi:carbonic anhydrase
MLHFVTIVAKQQICTEYYLHCMHNIHEQTLITQFLMATTQNSKTYDVTTIIYKNLHLHNHMLHFVAMVATEYYLHCMHHIREQTLLMCRWFRFAQLAKGKKFRP